MGVPSTYVRTYVLLLRWVEGGVRMYVLLYCVVEAVGMDGHTPPWFEQGRWDGMGWDGIDDGEGRGLISYDMIWMGFMCGGSG